MVKKRRYDVVVFTWLQKFALVEMQHPVKLAQATFDQIARYNMTMNAQYLMVTNGLNHYFCQMDFENEKYDSSYS
jgi:predicted type IV restriction endonuclease